MIVIKDSLRSATPHREAWGCILFGYTLFVTAIETVGLRVDKLPTPTGGRLMFEAGVWDAGVEKTRRIRIASNGLLRIRLVFYYAVGAWEVGAWEVGFSGRAGACLVIKTKNRGHKCPRNGRKTN